MSMKRGLQHIHPMYIGLTVLCILAFVVGAFFVGKTQSRLVGDIDPQVAAAYFAMTTTTDDLRQRYISFRGGDNDSDPIHIAILPGHEPGYGGAVYKDLYERDMNIELVEYLESFFDNDDAFAVTVLRDEDEWLPELQEYFDANTEEVNTYVDDQKHLTQSLLADEKLSFVDAEDVFHGDAPSDVAYRLYAINHWASFATDVDLLIHVHFNDTASRNLADQDPSGFSIYVPHGHYSNYEPSRDVAEYIFNRMKSWYAVSNHRQEVGGIISDHKLIALGASNTLDPASILIEYGYIYEHRFANDDVRNELMYDMALQTYRGVHDFFAASSVVPDETISGLHARIPESVLPLKKSRTRKPAVVALQSLLVNAGVYPPAEKTLRSCGIDGSFGPCTHDAVEIFQKQKEIAVDGIVGQETLDLLYSDARQGYRELLE